MHKQLCNEAVLKLAIEPDGPILIKASDAGGADPTRPDMEFVRTWHRDSGEKTIYLPGSSLKGVLRAHCERIVRSLVPAEACNPVDQKQACGQKLKQDMDGPTVYQRSCFICQIFGNTVLAGRLRIEDAYPAKPDDVKLEERNGVAIDRIFGSVAVGPFNFEVATAGRFQTEIRLHNFTLAQLGVVALALRDLQAGRLPIGFGKSRGLGRVKVAFESLVLRYPACSIENGQVSLPVGRSLWSPAELAGVGRFAGVEQYHYPAGPGELVSLPDGMQFEEDGWFGIELKATGDQVTDVWRRCMPAWREAVNLAGEAAAS